MVATGHGVLLVDKPAGMSSQAVVSRVKRAGEFRKVGHAGTLDPAATGLLVTGIGAGTRLLGYFVGLDKDYTATVRLGIATDTEDAHGQPTASPGCESVADLTAAAAQLTGDLLQRPSAVSAIKIDGERAYRRVRRGEEVELPERPITVQRFDILAQRESTADDLPVIDVDIAVTVSSGTYVRALGRDLAEAVDTVGHLIALRRTRVGPFRSSDACALDDVSSTTPLLTLGEAATAVLPSVVLPTGQDRAVALGQRIPATETGSGPYALLNEQGDLLAVATVEQGHYRYAMVVPMDAIPAFARDSGRVEGS